MREQRYQFGKLLKHLLPVSLRPGFFVQRYIAGIMRGGRLAGGLFSGMRYPQVSICGEPVPKYMGTYELELLPVFEKLTKLKFKHVTDVGAAEGYYAIGLCLIWPWVEVDAFELTQQGRELLSQFAVKNGVECRLTIHQKCTAESLTEIISSHRDGLIIMDVEGAECEILLRMDPKVLANFHLLVELHNDPATDEMLRAFYGTHQIEIIHARRRNEDDLTLPKNGFLRHLLAPVLLAHLHERPLPMKWAYLSPNN